MPALSVAILEAGHFLEIDGERAKVGGSGSSVYQEVDVVRHKAVRNQRHVVNRGASTSLQEASIGDFLFLESAMTPRRAKGEEISLVAYVRDTGQPLRTF